MNAGNSATGVPTAAELLADPLVKAALEQAWMDSLPGDPMQRHEEGGWIYMDLATGQVTTQRAPRGTGSAIDLRNPPTIVGGVVVGIFHTHPNPVSEGWNP